MSADENKATVRRVNEEMISQNSLDLADELFVETFVDHSAFTSVPPTREGVKQLFTMFRTGFPDLHVTIQDQVAEGDKVVTRKTLHGTHHGDLMGIAPIGKQVSIGAFDILRVVDGRAVDHWTVVDQLGLMQQLGVTPAPEEVRA